MVAALVAAAPADAYRAGFNEATQGASITYAPCPSADALGCYYPTTWGYSAEFSGRIFSATRDLDVVAHELGHRADDLYLDGGERHRFMVAARIPLDQPWSSQSNAHDHANEQFADAFAQCAIGYGLPGKYQYAGVSTSSYSASGKRHRRICRIIRTALIDRSDTAMPYPE